MKYQSYDIVCFGAPLVEIMRPGINMHMYEPGLFEGPYPSGDTAIMIDAAAKMGAKATLFGVIGEDDFGRCITQRLTRDGVDVSYLRTAPFETTGIAFVAYFGDGSRKFIFTAPNSAARLLCEDDVASQVLMNTKWLHISGFPLSISSSACTAVEKALSMTGPDVKVSFDPNLRPEVIKGGEIRRICDRVLERCDLFLPSAGEAALFAGTGNDDEGCRHFAKAGKLVVLKNGKDGCVIYENNERLMIPSYPVEEVDPTGAGDAFCGAFITALCENRSLSEAGRFANALGALSVTKKGPMEGIVDRAVVEALMKSGGTK